MSRSYVREWPPYAPGDQARKDGVLTAAKLIMNSAITAPMIGGIPSIEQCLVHGEEEQEKVARKMEELAYRKGDKKWENILKYEAVMVRESDAVIFIGSYRAAQSPLDAECGMCGGRPDCSFVYERRTHQFGLIDMTDRRKDTFVNGPLCCARVVDLGYAVGSALKMAANLNVDVRAFMSVGLAGLELNYCPNSNFVVGIPVSALSKSPYRDINPHYHLINMNSIINVVRETYVVTRQMLTRDYQKWDPTIDYDYAPCANDCPVHVDVPAYVGLIAQGKVKDAVNLIRQRIPLAGVCGRVCHHPCEAECRRREHDESISIMALKRVAADYAVKHKVKTTITMDPQKDERVAIVGSGPAGLNAAFHLRKKGYRVTVFEALAVAGGMLAVGIPDYRLPKDILKTDLDFITGLGIDIKTNTPLGKELTFNDLFNQGYKAIVIAIGSHKGQKLGIPGEDLNGVVDGLSFLKDINLGKKVNLKGKKVGVIGGGHTAFDAARSALRLEADEVTILYRRTREEMPVVSEVIEEAEGEGIKISGLIAPSRILGKDGKVKGGEFMQMRLGDVDESGRRASVPTQLPEMVIEFDTVIVAIGQVPEFDSLPDGHGLEIADNQLVVDPATCAAAIPGIFACGDVKDGRGTVIDAMASGAAAADNVDRYIKGEPLVKAGRMSKRSVPDAREEIPRTEEVPVGTKRESMPVLSGKERRATFKEVNPGYSEEAAVKEAKRCVRCDLEKGSSRFLSNPLVDKLNK